ncbi:hypothetical protein [Paenibacillus koleovorans]|uniref:hypothetical protein n=1 Tax=Paenibacillus koleovorans TaxID=121608 RepID=UPI000FDB65D2|nr:hypothetical protein [Paenibacillus koleovorans]
MRAKKWIAFTLAAAAVCGMAVGLTGCNDNNNEFKIKQEYNNTDRRGMLNDRNVDMDRVNPHLPQGGSEGDKNYRDGQNIRPSDSNGGTPNTIEGQGGQRGNMRPSTVGPSYPH